MIGIFYWVFAGSMGGYFLFSWANQYLDASLHDPLSFLRGQLTVKSPTEEHAQYPKTRPARENGKKSQGSALAMARESETKTGNSQSLIKTARR